MADQAKHTPGPWKYVPSTEYHGPYVTSEFGNTICDCYCMSNPAFLSVRNAGTSRPIHHLAEMADPNGRLIAAAPEMLDMLKRAHARLAFDNGTSGLLEDIRKLIAKAEAL